MLAAILAAGSFFFEWYKVRDFAQQQAEVQAANDVVTSVGKLMLLPVSEAPVVVTIKDKAEIKQDFEFFRAAETGDKVLIYRTAKKAIIYRPSRNIIINVGSITVDSQEGKTTGLTAEQ